MIPNNILDNNDLSFKAKGLLCYLLRQPDDHAIFKTQLHENKKDGRDSVISAFNELVSAGYILATKTILPDTKRFYYSYIVYDEPCTPEGEPLREIRNGAVTGKPLTESRQRETSNPYNSTYTNTNTNTNKKEIYKEKESEEVRQFYLNEVKLNSDKKLITEYTEFAKYIFKSNPSGEPITPIIRLEHQCTYENFVSVMGYGDMKSIYEKLDLMLNTPKYLKDKKYLHLTLIKWLEKDLKR